MAKGPGKRRRTASQNGDDSQEWVVPEKKRSKPAKRSEPEKSPEPEERSAEPSGPSDLDAMGQDKRRQVIGHAYGPSRRSQIMFFVAVGAVLLVVVGGWFAAVAAFDQPADSYADKAPWSDPDTPQNRSADSSPASPLGPCGEPGNSYPVDPESPCSSAPNAGAGGAGESGSGSAGPE